LLSILYFFHTSLNVIRFIFHSFLKRDRDEWLQVRQRIGGQLHFILGVSLRVTRQRDYCSDHATINDAA